MKTIESLKCFVAAFLGIFLCASYSTTASAQYSAENICAAINEVAVENKEAMNNRGLLSAHSELQGSVIRIGLVLDEEVIDVDDFSELIDYLADAIVNEELELGTAEDDLACWMRENHLSARCILTGSESGECAEVYMSPKVMVLLMRLFAGEENGVSYADMETEELIREMNQVFDDDGMRFALRDQKVVLEVVFDTEDDFNSVNEIYESDPVDFSVTMGEFIAQITDSEHIDVLSQRGYTIAVSIMCDKMTPIEADVILNE